MKINSVSPNPSVNVSNAQNTIRQPSTSPTIKEQVIQESNSESVEITKPSSIQRPASFEEEDLLDPEKEKELMAKSIEQANHTLKNYDRYIERSVHEVTKTVMYTIKDSKTNEIIAEYPPKKIQDMIAKMWELAGLVVDKRV